MKKISLFVMFILAFIFSGCSVQYNLVVDNHHKISEEVVLLDSNDNILKYSSNISKFLNEMSSNFSNYNVSKIVGKDESGFRLNNQYSDFKSFKKSKFFANSFENLLISDDNDYYSVETTGEYYRNNIFTVPLESTFFYNVDDVVVNIKFYNKVISSNADKFDNATNTYTWILNKDERFEKINFELSKSVRYDIMFKDVFNRNKFLILIILGIFIILGIAIFNIKNIKIRNNRI